MGIIKALAGAIGGSLADQWLETIEPDNMSDTTVFTKGVTLRKGDNRSSNKKASADAISNGSIIHVYDNQMMLLIEGGKIIDYTAEPGYYKVDDSTLPSLFNGQFKDSLMEAFSRIKYGGTPSSAQKAFYLNLQEIKGIKFGTRNPINYFDNFYNAELFLRTHGSYSIKIVNPILFYSEVIPKNTTHVDINDINEQYLNEFLEALQSAINKMSADGERISFVVSKSRELSKYMADILDEDWSKHRGMAIQAVGIGSISYAEESTKLINMRNQGAMLSDPSIREGYVQGSVARGMEAAGSNSAGSMAGFMGMGVGMQAGGGFVGAASQANQSQNQGQTGWKCSCGNTNNQGNFCANCGSGKESGWKCSCGHENKGNFCADCGKPKSNPKIKCNKCGFEPDLGESIPKFCPNCGDIIDNADRQA